LATTEVIGTEFFLNTKNNLKESINKLPADRLYAVRSSGTSEDNINYSYAGMYDSFLNIYHNEINKYVQKCLNSSVNTRLKTYEKHISSEKGKLAVIIQEMVPSEFSGILFTANSINKNKDEMIIEIAQGYGDKIVGGETTPITYIINKTTSEIKETHNFIDILTFDTYSIIFNELLKEAKRIEKLFNCPVDIEWSIANTKLYILQARPIVNI